MLHWGRVMKTAKTLQAKAEVALKKAVQEVIKRHKHTGRPLAVWQDGKVVMVPAHRFSRKSR